MRSYAATRFGCSLQHEGVQPGPGQIPGSDKPCDTGSDDQDVSNPVGLACHGCAWMNSTNRVSTCGSVDGGTPWPRFTTWPGALRPDEMTSRVWA